MNLRVFDMKIFFPPADANTEMLNFIVSTSDKEMNIAAADGELATVKATNRPCPDHSDAKRVSHKRDQVAGLPLGRERAASRRWPGFGLEVSGD